MRRCYRCGGSLKGYAPRVLTCAACKAKAVERRRVANTRWSRRHQQFRVRLPKTIPDYPEWLIELKLKAAVEAKRRERWDAQRRSE